MFIVLSKRKILNVFAIAVAVVFIIGASFIIIVRYVESSRLTSKYETLISASGLIDGTNLQYQLTLENEIEREYKNIEIFDVSKGKVIKTVKSNSTFQIEAEQYLRGITGVYVKVQAFPIEGYIIRIPFEPNIAVQNKWLKDYGINILTETFIILPNEEKPYLLVLDQYQRPIFYDFEGDTNALIETLDFKQ